MFHAPVHVNLVERKENVQNGAEDDLLFTSRRNETGEACNVDHRERTDFVVFCDGIACPM